MNYRQTMIAFVFVLGFAVSSVVSAVDWPTAAMVGNFQPYGMRSGTRVGNPPYFALHPPVYYGNRHVRPYGISPFAMVPQVVAPPSYKARIASDFVNPPKTHANPYCDHCTTTSGSTPADPVSKRLGTVRQNPLVPQSNTTLATEI